MVETGISKDNLTNNKHEVWAECTLEFHSLFLFIDLVVCKSCSESTFLQTLQLPNNI